MAGQVQAAFARGRYKHGKIAPFLIQSSYLPHCEEAYGYALEFESVLSSGAKRQFYQGCGIVGYFDSDGEQTRGRPGKKFGHAAALPQQPQPEADRAGRTIFPRLFAYSGAAGAGKRAGAGRCLQTAGSAAHQRAGVVCLRLFCAAGAGVSGSVSRSGADAHVNQSGGGFKQRRRRFGFAPVVWVGGQYRCQAFGQYTVLPGGIARVHRPPRHAGNGGGFGTAPSRDAFLCRYVENANRAFGRKKQPAPARHGRQQPHADGGRADSGRRRHRLYAFVAGG